MKKVITSDSQTGRERETNARYTSPERRPPAYTRYVQPGNDHMNNSNAYSTESCPLEDPRNPFHQEYLKLKEKADGDLDIKSGVFSPRKQAPMSPTYQQRRPIYVNEGTSNHAANPHSYSPEDQNRRIIYVSPKREDLERKGKSGSDTTPSRVIRSDRPSGERRKDNEPTIKYSRPPIYTNS